MLKLTNDIMETIDSGKITIPTALDMSAAFDTLDHITLLHRFQHTFGLSGYVISWIRSYLTDRSSFVKIDSSSSPSTTIPRGSGKLSSTWSRGEYTDDDITPISFTLSSLPLIDRVCVAKACPGRDNRDGLVRIQYLCSLSAGVPKWGLYGAAEQKGVWRTVLYNGFRFVLGYRDWQLP